LKCVQAVFAVRKSKYIHAFLAPHLSVAKTVVSLQKPEKQCQHLSRAEKKQFKGKCWQFPPEVVGSCTWTWRARKTQHIDYQHYKKDEDSFLALALHTWRCKMMM